MRTNSPVSTITRNRSWNPTTRDRWRTTQSTKIVFWTGIMKTCWRRRRWRRGLAATPAGWEAGCSGSTRSPGDVRRVPHPVHREPCQQRQEEETEPWRVWGAWTSAGDVHQVYTKKLPCKNHRLWMCIWSILAVCARCDNSEQPLCFQQWNKG